MQASLYITLHLKSFYLSLLVCIHVCVKPFLFFSCSSVNMYLQSSFDDSVAKNQPSSCLEWSCSSQQLTRSEGLTICNPRRWRWRKIKRDPLRGVKLNDTEDLKTAKRTALQPAGRMWRDVMRQEETGRVRTSWSAAKQEEWGCSQTDKHEDNGTLLCW